MFPNDFNSKNVRDLLTTEGVEFHATKPNSHTGNSDIKRLNNTLTKRFRALRLGDYYKITRNQRHKEHLSTLLTP